ncbi:MAG TPA: glycoside hydrolase family 15 protein [Candidatus Saccharimonadales bacterium]|nr:glycoside hydrolase family 15 protein [Candidatus Saccharimonadales bacterium]
MDDRQITEAIEKSAGVVLQFQQASGAYPASPNFKAYNYSWFRDGAFIADGMSRAGYIESAEKFFDWCADIINTRRNHILSGGVLDARYTYDGQESHEEWETFQLDGFGTLLWAIKQHEARHQRSIEKYTDATGLIQHYLATHWQEPCFDWWEERKGIHAASLACIYSGLKAYDHPEADNVKHAINLSNERTDSSLLICSIFEAITNEDFSDMLSKIESQLVSPNGGVYRYREDSYYGGGEWPVLTALLGWYYFKNNHNKEAGDKLAWIIAQMQPNGWIAEQSQEHMLQPDNLQPWVDRWGSPANPLLWSQAMLITLATLLKGS